MVSTYRMRFVDRRNLALLLLVCILGDAIRDRTGEDVTSSSSYSSFTSSTSSSIISQLLPFTLTPLPTSAFFLVRSNSSNIEAPSPYFVFGVTNFEPILGEFVRANPDDACETLSTKVNVTGKVVWIEPYGCSIEAKIRHCARAGCIAAVSASAYRIPGNEMWTAWDGPSTPLSLDDQGFSGSKQMPLTVPFVHVGRDDAILIRQALQDRETELKLGQANNAKGAGESTIGTSLDGSTSTIPTSPAPHIVPTLPKNLTVSEVLQNITNFYAVIRTDSPNQWEVAFSSLYFTIFFQAMLGSLHILVFLAAAAKFKRYWLLRESRPFYAQIPLVCLGFIVFSNIERGLYCFLDPMGATHVVPRGYRLIMTSISVPWTYASTLLLMMWWSEAIGEKSRFEVRRAPEVPKRLISAALAAAAAASAASHHHHEDDDDHIIHGGVRGSTAIEMMAIRSSMDKNGLLSGGGLTTPLSPTHHNQHLHHHALEIPHRKSSSQPRHKSLGHQRPSVGRVDEHDAGDTDHTEAYHEPFQLGHPTRRGGGRGGEGAEEEDEAVEEYVEKEEVQFRPDEEEQHGATPVDQYQQHHHHHHPHHQQQQQQQRFHSPLPMDEEVQSGGVPVRVQKTLRIALPAVPPPPPSSPPHIPAPPSMNSAMHSQNMKQAFLSSPLPSSSSFSMLSTYESKEDDEEAYEQMQNHDNNGNETRQQRFNSDSMNTPNPTSSSPFVHLLPSSSILSSSSNRYHGLRSEPLYIMQSHAHSSSTDDLLGRGTMNPKRKESISQTSRSILEVASPVGVQRVLLASTPSSTVLTTGTSPKRQGVMNRREYDALPAAAVAVSTQPRVSFCTYLHTKLRNIRLPSFLWPSKSSEGSNQQFLVRYRFSFFVTVFVIAVLDLIFSILDALYILDWHLLPLVDILFAFIGVTITSVYFYLSYRLFCRFKSEEKWALANAEYNAMQGVVDDVSAASVDEKQVSTIDSPRHAKLAIYTPSVHHAHQNECKEQQAQYHPPGSHGLTPQMSKMYAYPSTPVEQQPRKSSSASQQQQQQLAPPHISKHAEYVLQDLQRAHKERRQRLLQFLIGTGFGLLLFLAASLASPQIWYHPQSGSRPINNLDDPVTTISRDFLIFFALFIIGACQVCAF